MILTQLNEKISPNLSKLVALLRERVEGELHKRGWYDNFEKKNSLAYHAEVAEALSLIGTHE